MTDLQHVRALGDKSQRIRTAQFIPSDSGDSAQFIHGETVISPKSARFNTPKTAMRMKFPPDGTLGTSRENAEVAPQSEASGTADMPIDFHRLDDAARDKMVAWLEPPFNLLLRWMQYTALDKALRATTHYIGLSKYRRSDNCFEVRTEGDGGELLAIIPGGLYWETLHRSERVTPTAYGLDLEGKNPVFPLFVGPSLSGVTRAECIEAFERALRRSANEAST